jgi:pimeloyl-ACP methyl ester carboxylesterase
MYHQPGRDTGRVLYNVAYYNSVPSANSLIIAWKIPGAWLVQINDVGHALFMQYPDKVNKVVQTFLSNNLIQKWKHRRRSYY